MRTNKEWADICEQITAGFIPGGDKRNTYASGIIVADYLLKSGFVKLTDTLLDVGCGNGRLAMGLGYHGFTGRYHGFDIVRDSIRFCQMAFKDSPRYTFHWEDLYSAHYYDKSIHPAGTVKYKYPKNYFDRVVAMSFFSHTGKMDVVERNISEIYKVLKVGGTAFTTWYFGDLIENEARSSYPKADVIILLMKMGFNFEFQAPWEATDQEVVILRKRS